MNSFYGLERRRAAGLKLAIAGAGAAGIPAVIYASLLDINYVLFDAEEGGGLMNLAKRVENMPGAPGRRGPEIVKGLLAQLERVGGGLRSREPVTAIEGGENGRPVALDGLFITKRSSGTELYERLGVALDGEGFVRVDRHGATNLAGVFAAGDITGEPWQIANSIGEGAVAALSVFKFLNGQKIRNLGWALGEEWER